MKFPRVLGPMLGRCAHLAKERMDVRLSQYDMTPVQTHTLLYLHRHQGQALQKAAQDASKGNMDEMIRMIRQIMQSPEGAALARRISKEAQKS